MLRMQPSGKAALNLGDLKGFHRMARALLTDLEAVARLGLPMIGLDPALVMVLRQDYPKQGLSAPNILLPQEFLVQELAAGVAFPGHRIAPPAPADPLHRDHRPPRRRPPMGRGIRGLGSEDRNPSHGMLRYGGVVRASGAASGGV
ncbi:hypothetical protein ACFSHQ_25930 [Gemmobacter lanyuensis]